jgi:hypothetical protein
MPRLSYGKRHAIRQALELQQLCASGAELLDQDLRAAEDRELRARVATAMGNLVRNWSVLQESVRVLKGDPMPGSLKPQPKPTHRRGWTRAGYRSAFGPIEPTVPTDAPSASQAGPLS